MRFVINALIVGLVVLVGGGIGLFLFAQSAMLKADATTIAISQNLIQLARATGISLPERHQLDCDNWRFQGMGKLNKMAASISFNSLVDEARSAEDAAMRFAGINDQSMMRAATADAVARWRHALDERAMIECINLQIQRRSY